MKIQQFKVFVVALVVPLCGLIYADQINALRFQNAISSSAFSVEDGLNARDKFTKDYRGFFTISYEQVNNLLPIVSAGGNNTITELVDKFQRVRLTGAYYLTPKFVLSLTVPVDFVRGQQPFSSNGNNSLSNFSLEDSGALLGDVGIGFKYKLTDYQDLWNLSFYGQVFLPTGDALWYNTDDSFKFTGGFAVSHFMGQKGLTKLYGNLGFTSANNATITVNSNFETLDASKRFNLGLGLAQKLNQRVEVFTEFASQLSLPLNEFQNPLLFNVGSNIYFKQFALYGGVGLEGPLLSENSEDRYFAGIKYFFKQRQTSWLPEQSYQTQPKNQLSSLPAPDQTAPQAVAPVQEKIIYIEKIKQQETMNKLEAALKVARRVNFQTGKAIIIPTHYNDLDTVIELLHKLEGYVEIVKIEGHTDGRGDADKNMQLSLDRANSIKNYFVSKGQLPESLFETRGFGESKPLVEEVDADSQRINRRVEIFVEKVSRSD